MKELNEKIADIIVKFTSAVENTQKEYIKHAQDQHTQLGGTATYDNGAVITFLPDDPVAWRMDPFRGLGSAQLMSDGTFYFVHTPRIRAQSKLIRKLPHGRVSETKDGAVQLTLKVFIDEDVDISQTIGKEAAEAKKAVKEWLTKK